MPFRSLPLAAALACLIACTPAGEGAAPPQDTAPAPASAASDAGDAVPPASSREFPALVVETVDHGRFELAAHRGQWVVVNFWATWCAPCLKEIPDLNALDAREDVQVVGLAYEETTAEDLRAFYAAKVRPTYPVAIVDVYAPPADFETPRGLPLTILVDPAGKAVHTFLGPVTKRDIEMKLGELAAGGVPESAGA
ncbi:TlpA family protein disulfide reductase [Silanimonas lenta]|uniref:TlpA family protein disulfide reductase n=1 Tax=Silanimonas lenta TaxID=265429 RepID=UPI0004247B34|nr:TlpA disulfide reductase family protein [Silanimonas lenta]